MHLSSILNKRMIACTSITLLTILVLLFNTSYGGVQAQASIPTIGVPTLSSEKYFKIEPKKITLDSLSELEIIIAANTDWEGKIECSGRKTECNGNKLYGYFKNTKFGYVFLINGEVLTLPESTDYKLVMKIQDKINEVNKANSEIDTDNNDSLVNSVSIAGGVIWIALVFIFPPAGAGAAAIYAGAFATGGGAIVIGGLSENGNQKELDQHFDEAKIKKDRLDEFYQCQLSNKPNCDQILE